ncbi:MAG: FAD binding domain-containing protein [Fidelibacterota bacterium]
MKYLTPRTATELLEIQSELPWRDIVFLAGGTDLMPRWELGRSLPQYIIDVKKIVDFTGIKEGSDEITIGALTTIQDMLYSNIIQNEFTALSDAASQFAGVQIRNRATIGGNICNASPAGDLLPGLYVYNAKVVLTGPAGTRQLPISEFITGPGETKLLPNEILASIKLPVQNIKSTFYKLGLRQAMAISVINFAITYKKNSSGSFSELTIAAGAVAPTVVALNQFTKAVVEGIDIVEAIELVNENIAPIDDIRATAQYRSKALKNALIYYTQHL